MFRKILAVLMGLVGLAVPAPAGLRGRFLRLRAP